MAIYVITCRFDPKRAPTDEIEKHLDPHGTWLRLTAETYFFHTSLSTGQEVFNLLAPMLVATDHVIAFRMDPTNYWGHTENWIHKWLNEHRTK